jgi:predicted PurR-regulated permease PerM
MKKISFIIIPLFIIAFYFFFSGLHYIKEILAPLVSAALLSMLVLPVCRKLERKLPAGLAITICVLLFVSVTIGFIYITYTQIALFTEDFPLLKAKALDKFHAIQFFLERHFHISFASQSKWIDENYSKVLGAGAGVVKSLLVDVTSGLVVFLLVVVYMFLFLLTRHRIKNFFLMIFDVNHHYRVGIVINKIERLALHYIRGLLIETIIVGVLNSIGYLVLGIRQAIFLGFLASLLNLIPYVGAIFGMIFPLLMVFVFKDSIWYFIGVIVITMFTHLLHAKYLTPKIVGGYIRINALATILVIVVGGVVWGIAGMVLFLPLLGIVKIIADNVEILQPFGYLIGEDEESEVKG